MSAPVVGQIRCSSSMHGSLSCHWKVKNFSSLDYTSRSRYESQSFHSSENVTWKLVIYPGGDKEEKTGYVSFFLVCSSAPNAISGRVKYYLTLRNSSNDVIERMSSNVWLTFSSGTGWGPQTVLKREDLLRELPDDTLVVSVFASFSSATVTTKKGICLSSNLRSSYSKLVEDFTSLYDKKDSCDAVVYVEEREILVHKLILCARSKVFAAMFESDTFESKTHRVEIPDFDYETIETMLKFLYSGILEAMEPSRALELLRASDKYDVDDLKESCSHILLSNINNANVVQMLVFADMYNASTLKKKAFEFFEKHKYSVDIRGHNELLKERPEIFYEMFDAFQKSPPSTDDEDSRRSDLPKRRRVMPFPTTLSPIMLRTVPPQHNRSSTTHRVGTVMAPIHIL